MLGRLDGGGPWATRLAVTPDGDAGEDGPWPTATPRVPQGPGDLGLRMVAEGYNGPEIGRQLGITAKTVDTYKQRIEEKLGLTHRTEYVRFAIAAGLLGDDRGAPPPE